MVRAKHLVALLLASASIFLTPRGVSAHPIPMTDAFQVMDIVQAHVPYRDDVNMDIQGEGSYAIVFWAAQGGHPAGSALFKKGGSTWSLIKLAPAIFSSAASLETLGVPTADAGALIADIKKVQKPE